jgi:hypothetical protein
MTKDIVPGVQQDRDDNDFIENDFDEDDFEPCENCDLPDACADFGCAIKNGIRKDYPIDGMF